MTSSWASSSESSVKSEDFRRRWADHQAKECMFGVNQIRHPVLGPLTLRYETLTVPADPGQTLVVPILEPGAGTAGWLALLGSWAGATA
ncbi:hypothetical protein ACFY71_05895 [Streptomyces cinerochromogenes]|uniref:MmyB family transcriptional regulator n=1 Tax=Streptomyces cinerochromogenes TaxID=66422 RepID=UPI0036C43141